MDDPHKPAAPPHRPSVSPHGSHVLVEGVDYPTRAEIAARNAKATAEHEAKEAKEAHEKYAPDAIRDTHTIANNLSVIPGVGGVAAAALDLGATVGQTVKDIAQGKSFGETATDVGTGLAGAGLDFLPAGVGVGLKVATGVAGSAVLGDECKLVQDVRNAVVPDSDTKPCRNFGQEALDRIKADAGPLVLAGPTGNAVPEPPEPTPKAATTSTRHL